MLNFHASWPFFLYLLIFFFSAFLCPTLAFQDLTFLNVSKLGFQVYEFPLYRKFHVNKLCWISWNNLFHSHLRCVPIFTEWNGLDLLPFRWFPDGSDGKESAWNARDLGSIPGLGRFPGERNSKPTPVFLLGESPWTEKAGRPQSMGLQRVRHDWVTKHSI